MNMPATVCLSYQLHTRHSQCDSAVTNIDARTRKFNLIEWFNVLELSFGQLFANAHVCILFTALNIAWRILRLKFIFVFIFITY